MSKEEAQEVFEFPPTFHHHPDPADPINFSPSLSTLTNSIRKSTRTLSNRLRSIKTDADFVTLVENAYGLPLVTNSRAGDWYVDPRRSAGGVYFKSTDGHQGQWGFSLRRLNLGLLKILGDRNGAIIVDSTRRGKRFPDSLAKTIPIWIAVINRVCFPEMRGVGVYTNPLAVSPSEASRIESRLEGWVGEFISLGLDISLLKRHLKKPLRPIWITPDSSLPPSPPKFTDFVPLVLLTASKMVGGQGVEGEYIQGAGDDHEGWASESGLTPSLFWENSEALLSADESDLLALICKLRSASRTSSSTSKAGEDDNITLIRPTDSVYVGSIASFLKTRNDNDIDEFGVIINCSSFPLKMLEKPGMQEEDDADAGDNKSLGIFDFPIPEGKRGAKPLREGLGNVVSFVGEKFASSAENEEEGGMKKEKVLVLCSNGNDVAVAVAVVLLCLFYNYEGKYEVLKDRELVDKAFVRRRLAWIAASREKANPSRTLLNSINSFLMERKPW